MKTKGKGTKALKKAAETKDYIRLGGDVPLIQDTTELISPEIAEKLLRKNKNNRPINWRKVEEYRKLMENNEWKLHAQGIIIDNKGNLLTGQKRLWSIVYSGIPQYMRISRGSPPDTADLIDRGTPQSSRDLASRTTERKHSPTEVSMIRACFALKGKGKPTLDEIAQLMVKHDKWLEEAMRLTRGVKKTKPMLMILGASCYLNRRDLFGKVEFLGDKLINILLPIEINDCWNRGAAFTLAMEKARVVCEEEWGE